ncbi:hypothetical protein [Desulfovibrio piger]|uniref:hypothetical protein n=1 Tax=Desulfovibrio piger TaxID=901 RepID=UPI003F07A245
MIDLSQEQEQKSAYGPVPSGSRVLVRLTIEKPKYSSPNDDLVAQAKSGLLQLFCKMEVAAGSYDGVCWYENITLPSREQNIRLTEGQQKACGSGGRTLRAIVEAVNSVDPKDKSPQADRKRALRSWSDLDGVEFPARLGISKEPYEGRDGRMYWSNTLGRILPCTDKEYQEIMNGGEFITDGPVEGDQRPRQQATRQSGGYADTGYPSGGYADRAPDNRDDVPF